MCLPNKPTLELAVTGVVNEKIASKANFSSHDITKALREKIDQNADAVIADTEPELVDPAETGTVHVRGRAVSRIDHEYVKDIVGHLYATGAMSGYQRNFNGTYMEYSPAAVATPPMAPSSDPDPIPPATDGSGYDGSSTI